MTTALLYAFLCLVWGSTWLLIRIGLADLSPFWSLAARMWPALIFLLLVGWARRTSFSLPRTHRASFWIVCSLIYPINYSLVYWAEQYVTSGMAAVMFSCMPFFVAVLSWNMLPHESPTRASVAGLLLGFAGLVTVYWDQLSLGDMHKVLGMLAICVSALLSAYSTILIRRDLSHVPAISLTVWTLVVGALLVPLIALGFEGTGTLRFTGRALATVMYLSIVASGLAFVVYYRLLSSMSALTLSLVAFITPVVALALGAAFDFEVLTPRARIGMALVLLGVFVAARAGARRFAHTSHAAAGAKSER